MKKGKSRNKRKKTRRRLLWIAIAVIGIAAVISAVCVAGMLATRENAWRTPEELLVEYMDHIPKKEYEEMYAMLHVEASTLIQLCVSFWVGIPQFTPVILTLRQVIVLPFAVV